MIINKIEFCEGIYKSEDNLDSGFNLFTSKNKNSIGKSTYCRLIFYSLGYSIPSTEKIDFNKVSSKIFLTERDKSFIISREKKELHVEIENEDFLKAYNLPEEHESFLSFLFGCENTRIVRNLLGLMYIDQEKGWTLLNRGKVIGNNRFSIDELISGLKNIDYDELFNRRNFIENQIEKFSSLINMNIIKEQYYKENNNLEITKSSDQIKKEIASIHLIIEDLKSKIKEIDLVIKQDKNFFDYIDSMNLYFKINGESIKITKDRIENVSNIEYLKAHRAILNNQIFELEQKKAKLVSNYEKIEYNQLNIFNENINIDVENEINYQLSSLNLDVSTIKEVLEENKKELKLINSEIKNKLMKENEYIKKIYQNFFENAKDLDIEGSLSDKEDYIFTNDLKCRTGAIFQKLIIAYKIAVLQVVEEVLGSKLIFVIDSPKSKELDDENTKVIMNFLKTKLLENQVLVFSIFSENELFIGFSKVIYFNKRAIENREKS